MTRGELVHIPQDTLLLDCTNDRRTMPNGFLKLEKPSKALFWEMDTDNPKWCCVFYRSRIWTVRKKDIYPLIEEKENAS
jgi:hypothetical protein|tara:strand:+ start:582 stop:818 length:237 start_codon:yes stop_codon:yes gene_type:complete